jgi:hypothetical protein
MKEFSWKECIENNSTIKITPDKQKAESLVAMAKARMEYLKTQEINESSAQFIFENYYTSLTEIIHALVVLNGFKINNHLCLGFYLRDVLKREDLFRNFDKCRYDRNSVVYYGKYLHFEVAKENINKIIKLIKEIEKYF